MKSSRLGARLAWALIWWAGAGLGTAAGATVRVQVAGDAGGRPRLPLAGRQLQPLPSPGGGHGPGALVPLADGARVPGPRGIRALDKVVAEETGPSDELTLETTLRLDRSSRAAVRAFEGPDPPEAWQLALQVFAHTSPVYLLEGSRPVVVPESVQDVLEKLDRLIAYTRRLEGFREESHREETLDVYPEAREVLERRLASP